MLKLTNISKSYTTVGFTQKALDGVTIAFRENEFAAILGPSGSGKTTMLNIIGGLDKYDEGDLTIEGISTKKYEDTDWDTYRNNRIGFVFQTYNLIPHQTVLANVELALTLSGVSKEERRERAIETLKDLGLEDHINKLPSQLSGGQMQRVAIARALINNPEILLADEPTGALDTETGIQVMELLKRIAQERLVILVTHNKDLAEKYANRIIRLRDGKIESDSRPFVSESVGEKPKTPLRKASMSFATAVSLSLSNLRTKLTRTLVTSLAGSIGIIGIAAILALATGINNYIRDVERDTMGIYPLTIQEAGFDLSSIFSDPRERIKNLDNMPENSAYVMNFIDTMFSYQNRNDLGSLKTYIDENQEKLNPIVQKVEYKYGITPQIYLPDTSKEIHQVNPDTILSSYGLGTDTGIGALSGSFGFAPMGSFQEISGDMDLIEEQFDMLAGNWPKNYDELVLVLSPRGGVSDYLLYAMGLRDRSRLASIIESVMESTETKIEKEAEDTYLTYEELMNVKFKVINPADKYTFDSQYNIWVDQSSDKAFMSELINKGIDLKIVGIVKAKPDVNVTTLNMGLNYTPELITHLMEEAKTRKVVKDQLEKPSTNVLTGNTFFQEMNEAQNRKFQFTDLIKFDETAITDAINFDSSALEFDTSAFRNINLSGINLSNLDFSNIDLSLMDFSNMEMPDFDMSMFDFSNFDLSKIDLTDFELPPLDFSSVEFPKLDLSGADFSEVDMEKLETPNFDIGELTKALADVIKVPAEDINTLITDLMRQFVLEQVENDVSDPEEMAVNLKVFLSRPEVQGKIQLLETSVLKPDGVKDRINAVLREYIGDSMQSYTEQLNRFFKAVTENSMEPLNEEIFISMEEQIREVLKNYLSSVSTEIQRKIIGQFQSQMMGQMQEQFMSGFQSQIMNQFQNQFMNNIQKQLTSQFQKILMPAIQSQIEGTMKNAMGNIPEQLQKALSINEDAFAKAFKLTMDEDEILEIMNTLMNPKISSYDKNMHLLGYADPSIPSQIDIYPIDFQAKEDVESFIKNYNDDMDKKGEPEKIVRYTDIIGAMLNSVTDIVNMISNILIAFVAISLVVSSIMIGVITYISVLERRKEIGILRAVGASKKDIRRVFNAETLIVGFVAGVFGIIVTLLLSIPANIIVYNQFDVKNLVQLPPVASIILIVVSMLLAFVAGLIPASAAAKKDPVEALRSE